MSLELIWVKKGYVQNTMVHRTGWCQVIYCFFQPPCSALVKGNCGPRWGSLFDPQPVARHTSSLFFGCTKKGYWYVGLLPIGKKSANVKTPHGLQPSDCPQADAPVLKEWPRIHRFIAVDSVDCEQLSGSVLSQATCEFGLPYDMVYGHPTVHVLVLRRRQQLVILPFTTVVGCVSWCVNSLVLLWLFSFSLSKRPLVCLFLRFFSKSRKVLLHLKALFRTALSPLSLLQDIYGESLCDTQKLAT